MEINKPDGRLLNSYVRIYDNLLPEKIHKSFLKICKDHEFNEEGHVASNVPNENILQKEIRDVKVWPLRNLNETKITNVHWCNLFLYFFNKHFKKYVKEITNDRNQFTSLKIETVDVLKYNTGGHYKFHADHGPTTPRTLSAIYFLNDDYEGGQLAFRTVAGDYEMEIEKVKNRLIVWPSDFLYQHAVKPVTKGERYSVVTWAL